MSWWMVWACLSFLSFPSSSSPWPGRIPALYITHEIHNRSCFPHPSASGLQRERTGRWQERKAIITVGPPPRLCLPHLHCCLQVPRLQPSSPSSLEYGKGKRLACKQITPCSRSHSRALQVQRRKARLHTGGRRKGIKFNLF